MSRADWKLFIEMGQKTRIQRQCIAVCGEKEMGKGSCSCAEQFAATRKQPEEGVKQGKPSIEKFSKIIYTIQE